MTVILIKAYITIIIKLATMQTIAQSQKTSLFFGTFLSMIGIAEKTLKYMSYIYYSVWFYNNEIQALLNNGNKVNITNLIHAQKLSPKI